MNDKNTKEKKPYIVKIRRFWFFWSTYEVTEHFIRASACAYDSDDSAMELPVNPWLVLHCTDKSFAVIPHAEKLELKIIGKEASNDKQESKI